MGTLNSAIFSALPSANYCGAGTDPAQAAIISASFCVNMGGDSEKKTIKRARRHTLLEENIKLATEGGLTGTAASQFVRGLTKSKLEQEFPKSESTGIEDDSDSDLDDKWEESFFNKDIDYKPSPKPPDSGVSTNASSVTQSSSSDETMRKLSAEVQELKASSRWHTKLLQANLFQLIPTKRFADRAAFDKSVYQLKAEVMKEYGNDVTHFVPDGFAVLISFNFISTKYTDHMEQLGKLANPFGFRLGDRVNISTDLDIKAHKALLMNIHQLIGGDKGQHKAFLAVLPSIIAKGISQASLHPKPAPKPKGQGRGGGDKKTKSQSNDPFLHLSFDHDNKTISGTVSDCVHFSGSQTAKTIDAASVREYALEYLAENHPFKVTNIQVVPKGSVPAAPTKSSMTS